MFHDQHGVRSQHACPDHARDRKGAPRAEIQNSSNQKHCHRCANEGGHVGLLHARRVPESISRGKEVGHHTQRDGSDETRPGADRHWIASSLSSFVRWLDPRANAGHFP